MAEEGTFCINGDVVKKAGTNASATSIAEAFTNIYIKQAEGRIMVAVREDLKSNYGTLNAGTKELLREASSNLAASYAIRFDMSGFTSRIEAEDMINVLTFNFNNAMKIISDQKSITYSGVDDTVSGGITVREVDSDPTVSSVKTIVFPNGSVTDDGSGQVSVVAGGILNVVEDTTPQLGGNLDIQAFNIETAIAADFVKLNALTATATELNYVDGVTSAIQTQLNTKLANVSEDSTPELGGELDCGANSIGFTQQSDTGDGTTTIDWKLGNKYKHTFGAQNETFTFTAPSNPCNILLMLVQDGTGGRTVTWPGTVKWPSATAPTLSTGIGDDDIDSLYYGRTNYYGVGSLDFS